MVPISSSDFWAQSLLGQGLPGTYLEGGAAAAMRRGVEIMARGDPQLPLLINTPPHQHGQDL